jgi:hypothetical protein
MLEDGQYDWNMQHVLTGLIKFVVVDGSTYENFNMIYHKGINLKINSNNKNVSQ